MLCANVLDQPAQRANPDVDKTWMSDENSSDKKKKIDISTVSRKLFLKGYHNIQNSMKAALGGRHP